MEWITEHTADAANNKMTPTTPPPPPTHMAKMYRAAVCLLAMAVDEPDTLVGRGAFDTSDRKKNVHGEQGSRRRLG